MLAQIAGRKTPDLIYTVIGGGLMGLWGQVLNGSVFDIIRDRAEGTLELIVGSSTSLSTILAARVFTNVVIGFASLAGSFLIAVTLFHFRISIETLPSLIISLGIVAFTFWCLGVFLGNFQAWSRLSGAVSNYLEMPVAILSGFMFPVSVLPVWLLPLSAILPMRWAVIALVSSLSGFSHSSTLWQSWLLGLSESFIYLLLARWLADKVHDKIRVSGELSLI